MMPGDDGKPMSGEMPTSPEPVSIADTDVAAGLRVIDSRDLMAGQSSLLIRHLGVLYRLQTTRQGKLILTK